MDQIRRLCAHFGNGPSTNPPGINDQACIVVPLINYVRCALVQELFDITPVQRWARIRKGSTTDGQVWFNLGFNSLSSALRANRKHEFNIPKRVSSNEHDSSQPLDTSLAMLSVEESCLGNATPSLQDSAAYVPQPVFAAHSITKTFTLPSMYYFITTKASFR